MRYRGGRTLCRAGAFAELAFPAPTVFVYEERKHAWVILPTHVERLARRGV
jgi:hypothetical protein